MQVQIEDVSPVEKKLTFEIPWETVQAKLSDAYAQLSKSVSLKGFRKGKVPRTVIQQMFGKQVQAEVAGELVRDSFVQAVQQHNLQVVSEPHVHDPKIKKGEPFTFHAHVEVRAPVELAVQDYEKLAIERRVSEVTDEQVQQALEQLQREHTDLESIEDRKVTASGDVLSISITGTIGDQDIDQPQYMVDLDDTAREGLPGLAAALTGIPVDAAGHAIELAVPKQGPGDGDDDEDRVARLSISILDARKKNVPALDDELAKDTGRAETLDELRVALREELEKRAAEETQRDLREAALKQLVKRNQIPVADGLVQRAVANQMQRLQQMFGGQADTLDALGPDLADKLKDGAADDVRGEFLIEAVATGENVQVTDEELAAKIEELASYQGKPANRLRAELERDDRLGEIQFSMRRDKTLDLLVERAVVTDAAPEAETPAEAAPPKPEKPAKKTASKPSKKKAKVDDPG